MNGKHKALRLAIARQSDAVAMRAYAVSVERTAEGKALALVRFAFAAVLKAHGTKPRQPSEALNVVRDQPASTRRDAKFASERVRKGSVVRLVGKGER